MNRLGFILRRFRRTQTQIGIPLSANPDPTYFVEGPHTPFDRLVRLIGLSDGAVLGVTGVRGCGKSVLLNKIVEHFRRDHHTIQLSAPISVSREMDFFVMLFRLVCDSVILRLQQRVFGQRLDLKAIGTREVWKRLALVGAIAMFGALVALSGSYVVAFYAEKQSLTGQLTEASRLTMRALSEERDDAARRATGKVAGDLRAKLGENERLRGRIEDDQSALSELLRTAAKGTGLAKATHDQLAGLRASIDTLTRNIEATKAKKESYWRDEADLQQQTARLKLITDTVGDLSSDAAVAQRVQTAIAQRTRRLNDIKREGEILREKIREKEPEARRAAESASAGHSKMVTEVRKRFSDAGAKLAGLKPNFVELTLPGDQLDFDDLSRLPGEQIDAEGLPIRRYTSLSRQESWQFISPASGRVFRALRLSLYTVPLLVLASYGAFVVVATLILVAGARAWRAMRFRRELGLLTASQRLAAELEYEISRTRDSEVTTLFSQRLTAKLKLSEQRRTRPLTLPGLTAEYVAYIAKVLEVFPGKLIICIDELDKVSDLEHVRFILREIKGALFVRGCFYLLSISEDAMRAFQGRFVDERDIFESTFDEVLPVGRLELAQCHEIVGRRLEHLGLRPGSPNAGLEPSVSVAAALSGGVARDLIRNIRDAIVAAGSVASITPLLTWEILFLRKVEELRDRIKTSRGNDEVRAELIDELEEALAQRGAAEVSRALMVVDARIEWLRGRIRPTPELLGTPHVENELSALRRWIGYWIELKLYWLARGYVAAPDDGESRTSAELWSALLRAYAMLPYSIEACERRISRLQVLSQLGRASTSSQ